MASSGRVMEKPVLQEQQALKCPRCDSSNTKFCYYNNYSLSQPRHFCKACKRYWTRGGTLRNVPVGGGYRKNKKVKKSGGGGGAGGGGSGSDTNNTPLSQQIHASTSTSHINQLLYGLPSNSSFSNFPFQRFNSRNSVGEEGILQSFNGYNHQSQLSGLGLSFPSSSSMNREEHDYGAGFTHNNTQVQDLSLLGTSNYASYAANASLLASSLQKQKQVWNGMKETSFQSLLPFQNLQMGSNGEASLVMDLVKSEEGKDNRSAHRMEWRVPSETHDEPLGSLDSSLYNWNSASVATWPDLANYGSSVTPLI